MLGIKVLGFDEGSRRSYIRRLLGRDRARLLCVFYEGCFGKEPFPYISCHIYIYIYIYNSLKK